MADMLKIFVLKEDRHPKTGMVWIKPGMVGTVAESIGLRLISEGKARLWKEGDHDPQAPPEPEEPQVLHVHHHHHVDGAENNVNNQQSNKEDNNGNSNG